MSLGKALRKTVFVGKVGVCGLDVDCKGGVDERQLDVIEGVTGGLTLWAMGTRSTRAEVRLATIVAGLF